MTSFLQNISLFFLLFICCHTSIDAQLLGPDDKIISIYFGGGSYYIDSEQHDELVQFIKETKHLEKFQIEVHGHTDNIGSLDFNKYLSFMRCSEVVYILEGLEIEPETIFQYDHGEANPDYDNRSWNGKQHNRRVDVILRKLHL